MLDEKTMVSDALAGVNGELVRYGEMCIRDRIHDAG